MADSINPKKVNPNYDKDATPGIKIDPGPYIGIVKNNVDPTRLGRLEVWIAELQGEETGPYITVSYASPFFGSTVGKPGVDDPTTFGTEAQTYGFWAVPPDLENQVLVTFVNGDISRGFWFACIQNTESTHMTPGIARPSGTTQLTLDPTFGINRDVPADNIFLPGSEVNLESVGRNTAKNYLELDRVLHTYQSNIVIQQGLESDPDRGTITSSSTRESPSRVFGFSTPGRGFPDLTDKYPDRESLDEALKLGNQGEKIFDWQPTERKGGHTFVMDDGDLYGDSQLVRLRSAGGHQILFNDTNEVLYIINNKGTAWLEFTPKGSINIYSGDSLNLRSEMDLNFHADGNVNINAGSTIKMYAGASIESQTSLQLITAKDLYNINAGVVGLRSGGSLDIRALNASIETAGLFNIKTQDTMITSSRWVNVRSQGNVTFNSQSEFIISSNTNASSGVTSGWKVGSGELWLKGGDQVYINTAGKVPENPKIPPTPVEPLVNPPMELYQQENVRFNPDIKRWELDPQSGLASIAPLTPTHEPWTRQTGKKKLSSGLAEPNKDQEE
jgi:hypothetical protein